MSEKKGFFERLFGGKKESGCCSSEQSVQQVCCCGKADTPEPEKKECKCREETGKASILILGSGCKNCKKLEENTRTALRMLGDQGSEIGHVTDFEKIAGYGIMHTPGLVVNGKIAASGQVLKPEEIAEILKKMRG